MPGFLKLLREWLVVWLGLFLCTLQCQFLHNVKVLVLSKGGDGILFRQLRRSRLESDFLRFEFYDIIDHDIFLEIGDNNAVKLFERRTDARFTAVSCDASHGHFVGAGLRFFSNAQLDHSKRQKRQGSRDNFCHSKLSGGFLRLASVPLI
jgi:hypothetical protein